MGRDRYKIYDNAYPHFLTCTIAGWTPIFTRQSTVDIVLESWNYLRENREFRLFAFVILENHLHLIASSPNLAVDIGDFKSYTARRIIDFLKSTGQRKTLKLLRYHKKRHKTDREFQLWEEGSHPKEIDSDEMMWQKIEYIHDNPVKRGYVDLPEHWRYSSARNYMQLPGLIYVDTDWR